jgi:hypothetical protein
MGLGERNAPEVVDVEDTPLRREVFEEMTETFVAQAQRLAELRARSGCGLQRRNEPVFDLLLLRIGGTGRVEDFEVGVWRRRRR